MRTADDFDLFYRSPDPWGIGTAPRRDRALSRIVRRYIEGKNVLELGSGEGHLTGTVFVPAKQVTGVDISSVAVERATARHIPNASFTESDFLSVSFGGYDVIAAIECLYYLSHDEQETFFQKLTDEHQGIFIMSAPIIGANEHRTYFTHAGLLAIFERHGLALVEWGNLNAYRNAGAGGFAAAALARLSDRALPLIPDRFVYQRCYVTACKRE